MKQSFILIAAVCLNMIVSSSANAQTSNYDVLDINKIASMLISEKKSGKVDNASFVAYWESLGFQKDEQIGKNQYFYKLYLDDKKKEPLTVQITTRDNKRRFELNIKDNGFCWYHFIRLKKFGLKGPNAVAKGKGLTAMAGADFLWIEYELPQKAK